METREARIFKLYEQYLNYEANPTTNYMYSIAVSSATVSDIKKKRAMLKAIKDINDLESFSGMDSYSIGQELERTNQTIAEQMPLQPLNVGVGGGGIWPGAGTMRATDVVHTSTLNLPEGVSVNADALRATRRG